jgi:hypothetical protein
MSITLVLGEITRKSFSKAKMRQKQEESAAREPNYFIDPRFAASRPVQPFQPEDEAPLSLVEKIRISLLRLRADGRHGHS